jgi:thiamine biosynthesis protein ThiS
MTKTIQLNGEPTPTPAATIAELVAAQSARLRCRGVAVARNRTVVHRADWTTTPVEEGDRIEIIRPIVGG